MLAEAARINIYLGETRIFSYNSAIVPQVGSAITPPDRVIKLFDLEGFDLRVDRVHFDLIERYAGLEEQISLFCTKVKSSNLTPADDEFKTSDRAIMIALLVNFWGDCSQNTNTELREKCQDLRIFVTDDPRYSDQMTIGDLLEEVKKC